MNKTLIGLIAIIIATLLDSVLPIIFQESNIEIYSYLFLMSIVFIILSITHIFIFKKNLSETLSIISKKSNDLKITYYGTLRYIKYLLFTFGALSVQTGIYNALITTQLIFLTYSSSKEEHEKLIRPQISSFFILSLGIGIIIYNSLVNEKNKISKNFIIGALALIIALILDIKDDSGFKSLSENPYEDILLSSIIMFIISLVILGFRKFYLKKKFGISGIHNLLYLIAVPILIVEYLPTLLEFTSYDYLPTIIIMIFFGIQTLIGFGLDKYYYKDVFTSTKIIGIVILMIGVIYAIYAYYLQNKKITDVNPNQSKVHRFFFYK
jgi:drug/metabolite transporter (DMT)-like permease